MIAWIVLLRRSCSRSFSWRGKGGFLWSFLGVFCFGGLSGVGCGRLVVCSLFFEFGWLGA